VTRTSTLLPAFLDTNVPMYAAGTAHPYREACDAHFDLIAGIRRTDPAALYRQARTSAP
jgi:predicted nucleic acid-binding protein